MSQLTYGTGRAVTGDRTRTLFGQTMGYVALTAGFFALGAYLGRHLSEGWAFVWYIVAVACLIGMNFTARPLLAASIFLDVLNVFLFFLRIFSREN